MPSKKVRKPKLSRKTAPKKSNGLESFILREPDVKMFQVMDANGKANEKLIPKELSREKILKAYEWMVLGRLLDVKMLAMQRTGRLYTFATIYGQEASNVGSAMPLEKDDWLFPCFRETAAMLMRGIPVKQILQLWGGDERGHYFAPETNTFTTAIPVGTQTLHGVGAAMASTIKKEKKAFIVYFGDGATSEGDTMEAINFAGAFKAPIVLFCQNNQWAISFPRNKQTAAKTLAQKGLLGGVESIQVDGNDFFAVYSATKYALDKARSGKGPTFIESYTYRLGDHTTADDQTKYRDSKEVSEWKKKDPIDRMRKYLTSKKWWSEKHEEALIEKLQAGIEQAVKEYEAIKPADPDEIFNYTYEKPTPEIEEHRALLKEYLANRKEAKGE